MEKIKDASKSNGPFSMKNTFLLAVLFVLLVPSDLFPQSQEDFNTDLSEIYVNAGDAKKAKELAEELFLQVENNPSLQSYANYFMLSQIFENQVPDKKKAEICKEKADKLLYGGAGANANNEWLNTYYPALFTNTDPENASKARKFLDKNEGLQNFNNYTFIAYAYERNGDFEQAREMYELAVSLAEDDLSEYHSYSFYTNFLARSGEYLKAEEYINKIERLSREADSLYRTSYYTESLTTRSVYYLFIGDYMSYLTASEEMYDFYTKNFSSEDMCDPYNMSKYTVMAHSYEILGDMEKADAIWVKRDSSELIWMNCHNKKFPDNRQYPLSMSPVYRIKTGKSALIQRSREDLIRETEDHYNSYAEYANMNINHMKAVHLAFLGANSYHKVFEDVLNKIVETRDFTESTLPFSNYAYFLMRDGLYKESENTYKQLFDLNVEWINDLIFTFGEKAFVSYYNSKIKPGYDNYHSLVKIANEKTLPDYEKLTAQAYDNLLLTKSIAFKGTQKRKTVFLNSNDEATVTMYNEWILKKQKLIRLYQRQNENENEEISRNNDENEIALLQEEVNRLENQLANQAKGFKENLSVEQPQWQSVRKMLKDGEAAIELVRFSWRDQVYYSDSSFYAAYIIKKDIKHPEVVYLPTLSNDLDNKYFNQYKNTIRLKIENPDGYNIYWKPIKNKLEGINKVYFSPDGIYHLINLPTLKNPESGKYLLDEIDLHQVTSTNYIREENDLNEMKYVALLGRPDYEIHSKTEPNELLAKNAERSFVRNFRDNAISDLPGTEEEVKSIKNEMDGSQIDTHLYLHEQATEDLLYTMESPDILHIATHGFWAETEYPVTEGYQMFNAMVNSGLLLAGVVNYYSMADYPLTNDGILTAYEAQNLNLENTDLVVLSACETGLGHFAAGEGVYGLQRAFRAAGANSIIFSLWKVDDEATRDFMVTFYHHYLSSKDKFVSFKMAQTSMKEKYTYPYFWGAFVLVGE